MRLTELDRATQRGEYGYIEEESRYDPALLNSGDYERNVAFQIADLNTMIPVNAHGVNVDLEIK